MKIKLFLAPSIIIIAIAMLIWMVYPAYTNGADGVKEKYQKLKKQKRIMDKLDNYRNNAEKLAADLDADASNSAVVFDYISRKKEDEKIIDNLDLLARDSSLSVANISVSDIKNETVIDAEISGIPDVASKATPDRLKVDFSVFGSYKNIKIIVEKVQKLKRFSKISDLEIKTQAKEDQSLSESLLVNMTLVFYYVKEVNRLADSDIDNNIFSSGVFDKEIIEKIKNSRNISVNNVSPGQKGKTNPFLP